VGWSNKAVWQAVGARQCGMHAPHMNIGLVCLVSRC
jgi:hypothetical protein